MKNGGKVLFSIILSALLASSVSAAFAKTNTYNDNFNDVADDAWFKDNVKNTYELGLMDGTGGGVFNPDGNVTVAEAVTVASRAHATYNETEISDTDGKWYDKYVAYAKENGIVEEDFDDYERYAKRHEVASLFAKALPEEYYNEVNSVEEIPDVPESRPYYDDLLMLYNAGVVMGSDSFGFFYPESNITRAEIAAVISRAAIADTRLEKSLDILSEDGAFYLCYNGEDDSKAAWDIDLRGAVPKVNVEEGFSGLFDVFDDAGTAYIRRFNKTETGLITLETKVEIYGDGAHLEFRNDKDEAVYRLEIIDGFWSVLKSDGSYEQLVKANGKDDVYFVKACIDLDNGRSTTFIDGKEYEALPLLTSKEDTNILDFRFATTKEAIATIKPVLIDIYSNYALLDGFIYHNDGVSPYFWNTDESTVVSGKVMLLNGGKSASRAFNPVSGKIAAEFNMILHLGENISYNLSSKGCNVLEFKSENGAFYANGEKVYESFVSNLWYKMRFELDTDTQTVLVKLNGRNIAEVPFANASTSVDCITVENKSGSVVSLDNFKVFGLKDYENYVPVPVIPKGEEKYTLGLNVCSLWVEGTHAGWTPISAFDEIEPVLGYYDEGNPETADWEIKLMKEHGIDIQAFCWYADSSNAPLKNLGLASQLHDGFMNAKYSDMMSYCLIMEAANAKSPDSVESWKNYYVPFLIEHYFKDDRYAKINNRLPFGWFGGSTFISSIGGTVAAYEALEYLEDEVRKLGFDGMLYFLGNGEREANAGSDGYAAYSWGQPGYSAEVNIERITSNAQNGYAHHIPTVSVGFNNVAWAGTRYPLITKEDYDLVHNWVVSEHLPKYSTEKWHENFVWISTWNEYGEGTYVMPTTEGNKFAYLDVLRKYYTDEGEDESVNVVPDEEQKYRINHLYPQYRHDLRQKHTYKPEMSSAYLIDFSTHPSGTSSVDNVIKSTDGLNGIAADNDPIVQVTSFSGEVDLNYIPEIKITMKGLKGRTVEIFYKTSNSDTWSQDKSYSFPVNSDEMETYTFSTSGFEGWNGILTGFRIDPTQNKGESFTVKSAEFLTDYKSNMLSKNVTIDEKTFINSFAPEKNKAGEIVMVFDPQKYIHVRLNTFYTWDKDNGILTLEFKDHTVVYTIGSDKYIFDGVEKELGFTLTEIDGLPVIPIERLCKELGYKFTVNENDEIIIETPSLTYFDELDKNSALGVWEFNTPGYVEGWRSDYMTLQTDKGYMRAVSIDDFTDPIIWSKSGIAIPADMFNKLEIRVRYKYNATRAHPIQIYYITDVDKRWNEAKTINIQLKSTDSKGEFEEYVIDLSNAKEWKDTVTALRFDPFNASGEIDIDYIRFVYDPALENDEK